MQTRYLYLLRFILAITDMIVVNLCFLSCYYLFNKYGGYINSDMYTHNILTSGLIWLLSSSMFRLYGDNTINKVEHIYRATWKTLALHGFLFTQYLFFTDDAGIPAYFILSFYGLMVLSFWLNRSVGTALEGMLIRNFSIRKPVAILGMNNGGLKLAAYLEQQNSVNFAGFLGNEGYYINEDGSLLPAATEQLRMAASAGVNEVYVSLAPSQMSNISTLLKEAEKQCVRLKFVPDLSVSVPAF